MKHQPTEYEGIPVFLRFSDIAQQLAQYPKERETVEFAKQKGWRHALETRWNERVVAYSVDPKRCKFLETIPLSKDMTVLEIGVGFGQHTAEIASRVKQVDTLEVNLMTALFAKVRCEQEGVTNATFACGGDDCRLPFEDCSYDAVLLNLVLEWCASETQDESARAGQQRMLSEIHRVLKPNGLLQVNTKNRFSYRLLTGGPDEHTFEMPFGSALPRWVLWLILRLQGKGRPPGYLYSWGGLKRMLRHAGLSPIQSYWAVPEMRYPDHLIPVDTKSIHAARGNIIRQGESRRTNLLMRATPAWLIRYVTPGLFFIAQKK